MREEFAAEAAPTGYKNIHNRTRQRYFLGELLDPAIKSQDDMKKTSGDILIISFPDLIGESIYSNNNRAWRATLCRGRK
jgi:hypothetical protein